MKKSIRTLDLKRKGSACIFIVEDESIVAKEIEVILQTEGYQVMGPVASGVEAVELTKQVKPDLVLMDIHLNGKIDGIEAASQIFRDFAVPVVFLTAYSDPETLEKSQKANPFGFIIKPFSAREMISTIEMALHKSRVESKLNQLNIILKTVRNINQLITREKRADRLIQGACDFLIENKNYTSAWIVLLDERMQYTDAAETGIGEGFERFIRQMKEGKQVYCIRQAFRTRSVITIQDIKTKCANCFLAEYFSTSTRIIVRLEYEKILFGLLCISVVPQLTIDKEEYSLIQELAGDIAFALYSLKLNEKQKKVEKELIENQRVLSTLMINLPGMAYRSQNDENWTKEFVSEGCKSLTGYRPSDFVQNRKHSYPELILPQDRDRVWNGVQKALKDKKSFHLVYRIRTASGKEKWVLEKGRGVYSPKGKLSFIEGFITDITANKVAEQELNREKNLLRTVIDHIPDYIYVKDRDSRFLVNNQSHATLLHAVSANELSGKTDFDFLPKNLAEKSFQEEQEIMRNKRTLLNCEERIIDSHSREQWLLTTKVPLRGEKGHVWGLVCISKDITDRKLTEIALKRSNEELDQFTFIASHHMEEPLRMIVSFIQLLERRYKDKLDSDADQFIHFVVSGSMLLQQQISDLLDYVRVGTKGKPFESIDFSEILKTVLQKLESERIKLHAEVSIGPLPSISADRAQVMQLFYHLIDNAFKFHGARLPQVQVRSQEKETEWLFIVQDNGIGIESRFHEKIFEIFQRLNSQENYPGTGIGLALCKKIVERHGGRIWVDSTAGEGTTFYFNIPKNGGNQRVG